MRQSILLLFLLFVGSSADNATDFAARYVVNGDYPVMFELPEQLKPGQTLTFKAAVKPGGNDFAIQLQSVGGKSIPFFLQIHIAHRQVKLNSYTKLAWGTDEIKPHTLVVNQLFEVVVQTRDDHFKIALDGKDFAEYKYRQPLSFITQFEFSGHAFIYSYQLGENNKEYPLVTGLSEGFPVCKNGLSKDECKTLVVSGIVSVEWIRLAINILRKNGEIAHHFNPRYDENRVLMSTLSSNTWWNVHYVDIAKFPKVGEQFEVEFENREKVLKVSVNGKHFYDFPHGIPNNDFAFAELTTIREATVVIK